jgi:hypothetical protein
MNISLVSLLAIMGRINPAIWDVIVPMGPERLSARVSIGDEVELNPQPLPPRELMAVAEVAAQIALAAAAAEAAGNGEGAVNIVARAVDDWCGTGRTHWPWPRPWPGPLSGLDEDPGPRRLAEIRLVAALSMASAASRMSEGEARQALTIGADKLAHAAVGEQAETRERAMA